MTVTCPSGHESATTDYCDQCGAPIAARSATVAEIAQPEEVEELDTSAAELAEPCPECGAPRSGDDRYCEDCGHDLLASPAPAGAVWEAIAAADRSQFERVAPPGVAFPEAYPERRFQLNVEAMRIGRSRGRPGETVPEIDLGGEPHDPGVSHLHAELVRQQDGSYAVRDLGSTNGTAVNDDPRPLAPDVSVQLGPGDRIRLGAWTTITLQAGRG